MGRANHLLVLLVLALLAMAGSDLLSAGEMEGWLKFNQGLEKAAKEDKPILVDFYTDWCYWCKMMDEKTFGEATVAKRLKERFVAVKVNAENEKESVTYKNQTYNNVELTRSFGITGYPSLAFLNSKGELITLIPGYIPADKFIQILNYIDQKCYENDVSFDDFVKAGGCKEGKS